MTEEATEPSLVGHTAPEASAVGAPVRDGIGHPLERTLMGLAHPADQTGYPAHGRQTGEAAGGITMFSTKTIGSNGGYRRSSGVQSEKPARTLLRRTVGLRPGAIVSMLEKS